MKLKASFVVMSHLSDIQEEISINHCLTGYNRANFIKYIIRECKGDLNTEINPDEMWEAFSNHVVLVDMDKKDIPSFLTTKMKLVVADFLMDNKKLDAIKYIKDMGESQGKRIYLTDAKNYVDNL